MNIVYFIIQLLKTVLICQNRQNMRNYDDIQIIDSLIWKIVLKLDIDVLYRILTFLLRNAIIAFYNLYYDNWDLITKFWSGYTKWNFPKVNFQLNPDRYTSCLVFLILTSKLKLWNLLLCEKLLNKNFSFSHCIRIRSKQLPHTLRLSIYLDIRQDQCWQIAYQKFW